MSVQLAGTGPGRIELTVGNHGLFFCTRNFSRLMKTLHTEAILTQEEVAYVAEKSRRWQMDRLIALLSTMTPSRKEKVAQALHQVGNYKPICDLVFPRDGNVSELNMEDLQDHETRLLQTAVCSGDVNLVSEALEKYKRVLWKPHPETGASCLHASVLGVGEERTLEALKLLLRCYQDEILEQQASSTEGKGFQSEIEKLIDYQDKNGDTVLHLAAKQQYANVLQFLYFDYHGDIHILNSKGVTPQEIIAAKCPEVLSEILDRLGVVAVCADLGGKYDLEIDFGAVMPRSTSPESHRELPVLSSAIRLKTEESSKLLTNVLVELFLDLKWKRVKPWLSVYIGAMILLLLWYTFFVVVIFIATCPKLVDSGPEGPGPDLPLPRNWTGPPFEPGAGNCPEGGPGGQSVFNYFFGVCPQNYQSSKLSDAASLEKISTPCSIPHEWIIQAWIFYYLAILFLFLEMSKMCISTLVFLKFSKQEKNMPRKVGPVLRVVLGVKGHLTKVRNVLNFVHSISMMLTAASVVKVQPELVNPFLYKDYALAAVSILASWLEILIQASKIHGFGFYVVVLEKVFRSFCSLIFAYLTLIIAVSIAFRLIFPEIKRFQTLPQALEGVAILMTGEAQYYESFSEDNLSSRNVMISPWSKLMYLGFAVLICIILLNVLLGLSVSDVDDIRCESRYIWRTIQIEEMIYVENLFVTLNVGLHSVSKLVGEKIKKFRIYQTYVIHPEDALTYGPVLSIAMDDVPKGVRGRLKAFIRSRTN